jgi:uncharacterized delta-60 repeat protein
MLCSRFRATILALLPTLCAAAPGDLDPSFGIAGRIDMTVTSFDPNPLDLAVQPDGKIVATANGPFGDGTVVLIRLHPGGDLDTAFGNEAGRVVLPTSVGTAREVVVHGDGRLAVADDGFGELRVIGLTADGALDPTFGTGGIVETDVCGGVGNLLLRDAVAQPDGKVLLYAFGFGGCAPVVLARYGVGGLLDASFGAGGLLLDDLALTNEDFDQLVLQPDGKALLIGDADAGGEDVVALARYDTAGVLDAGFGAGGVVTVDLDLDLEIPDRFVNGVLLSDGRILTAVEVDPVNRVGFTRFDDTGVVDGSYGTAGTAITDLFTVPRFMLAQPGAKVVLVNAQELQRYDAAGALDPTFGIGGVALDGALDFVPFTNVEFVYGLAADAGGRLVLGTARQFIAKHDRRMTFRRVLMECGDGVLDPGEACDDGNVVGGDCCTPACTFAPAGNSCDSNGDLCTRDECDGAGTCAFVADEPQPTGCRTPFAPGKSLVKLQGGDPSRWKLTWKWTRGSETDSGAYGAPDLLPTAYALCIYDEALPAPNRLLAAQAQGAGTCVTKPCWSVGGSRIPGSVSFKYRDKARAADGLDRIALVPGPDNKAKITLKGKGADLPLPALPLAGTPAVRVQLKNGVGECWEASYSTPIRNSATLFKARSD